MDSSSEVDVYATVCSALAHVVDILKDTPPWDHLDRSAAMMSLAINNSEVELCGIPYNFSGHMSHDSDIIVGFWGTSEGTITLSIGGWHVGSYTIHPGQFVYAIDDAYIVPVLCLRFHEIQATFSGPKAPRVIGAFVDEPVRRLIATRGVFAPREPLTSFIHGMISMSFVFDGPQDGMIELPNMHDPNLPHFKIKHTIHKECTRSLHSEELSVPRILGTSHKLAQALRTHLGSALELPPQLHEIPPGVRSEIEQYCHSHQLFLVGNRCTAGDTSSGMHAHTDESYMGGTMTMLVYVEASSDGGVVEFFDELHTNHTNRKIFPKKGMVVLFGSRVLHTVDPVCSGVKRIVAVEVCSLQNRWALFWRKDGLAFQELMQEVFRPARITRVLRYTECIESL